MRRSVADRRAARNLQYAKSMPEDSIRPPTPPKSHLRRRPPGGARCSFSSPSSGSPSQADCCSKPSDATDAAAGSGSSPHFFFARTPRATPTTIYCQADTHGVNSPSGGRNYAVEVQYSASRFFKGSYCDLVQSRDGTSDGATGPMRSCFTSWFTPTAMLPANTLPARRRRPRETSALRQCRGILCRPDNEHLHLGSLDAHQVRPSRPPPESSRAREEPHFFLFLLQQRRSGIRACRQALQGPQKVHVRSRPDQGALQSFACLLLRSPEGAADVAYEDREDSRSDRQHVGRAARLRPRNGPATPDAPATLTTICGRSPM